MKLEGITLKIGQNFYDLKHFYIIFYFLLKL